MSEPAIPRYPTYEEWLNRWARIREMEKSDPDLVQLLEGKEINMAKKMVKVPASRRAKEARKGK